jgi:ferritin
MPKISDEMNAALNKQIKLELDSSYIYLSMSYWFKAKDLDHLALFFKNQAMEEREHALKIADYVLETDGVVSFEQIDKPKSDFESVDQILQITLQHEEHVTKAIYQLYDMAIERKEYNLKPLLDWFIEEQVEEEDQIRKLIAMRSYMSSDFYLDHRVKRLNQTE